MPAVLAIAAHLRVSSAMKLPKSCGEPERGLRADLGETVVHLLRFQAVIDRGVELGDDIRRRAGRHDDAGPERRDVIGDAALRHGRHVRQLRMALCAGDSERLDLLLAISASRIEMSGNVICTCSLSTAVTISAPLL